MVVQVIDHIALTLETMAQTMISIRAVVSLTPSLAGAKILAIPGVKWGRPFHPTQTSFLKRQECPGSRPSLQDRLRTGQLILSAEVALEPVPADA